MTPQQAGVSAEIIRALAVEIVDGLEKRGYMDLQYNKDDAQAARDFATEVMTDAFTAEALATAPPEQASQKQPCDCQQLCERLSNPLPPGRFCMAEAAQEKMRAEPPQAGGALAPELTDLTHTRSCPMLNPGSEEFCTCGLEWRIKLRTEMEMHNAWRKRAEEAEQALAAHDQKVRDDALEYAAQIADEHWPESGHIHKEDAVSCQMSISVAIRRAKSIKKWEATERERQVAQKVRREVIEEVDKKVRELPQFGIVEVLAAIRSLAAPAPAASKPEAKP